MDEQSGGHVAPPDENIKRTIEEIPESVSRKNDEYNHDWQTDGNRCGYVVTAEWRAGAARFCDARAVRGSSYCAEHRALCQVKPGSAAAARIVAAQARAGDVRARDGVFAGGRHDAVPEPLIETEPEEALAALAVRPRRRDDEEG